MPAHQVQAHQPGRRRLGRRHRPRQADRARRSSLRLPHGHLPGDRAGHDTSPARRPLPWFEQYRRAGPAGVLGRIADPLDLGVRQPQRTPRTWRGSQGAGQPTWRYRTGFHERLPCYRASHRPAALIGDPRGAGLGIWSQSVISAGRRQRANSRRYVCWLSPIGSAARAYRTGGSVPDCCG